MRGVWALCFRPEIEGESGGPRFEIEGERGGPRSWASPFDSSPVMWWFVLSGGVSCVGVFCPGARRVSVCFVRERAVFRRVLSGGVSCVGVWCSGVCVLLRVRTGVGARGVRGTRFCAMVFGGVCLLLVTWCSGGVGLSHGV